jgi:hypothetical protein
MKNMVSPGRLLLGIWLVATGLQPWVHVPITGYNHLLSVLAVIAGALILLGR